MPNRSAKDSDVIKTQAALSASSFLNGEVVLVEDTLCSYNIARKISGSCVRRIPRLKKRNVVVRDATGRDRWRDEINAKPTEPRLLPPRFLPLTSAHGQKTPELHHECVLSCSNTTSLLRT